MSLSFRRLLLAGTLLVSPLPLLAEPVLLADALRQGIETSPRIAQAKSRADAAEARARQAGVSPNPELSLQVENFAGTGVFTGLRSTETTLAVSQRFELGGKRGARVGVARAERDFAFLQYKAAQADLERDIRVAHAELRAAEDRAVLARDNVASARELVRTARLLVETGRDPPLRQMRAEALLAEAEAESARTFGDLLVARRNFTALTGIEDPEPSALVVDETVPAPLPPDAETLDVQLAFAGRSAAQARVDLARADAVPDITASGGIRRIGDGRDTALVAGFSLPLPLRNRNRGNIDAAQSESLAAESGLALARRDSGRVRYEARILFDAADARYAALAGPGLAQAQEALRVAQIGYNAGKFSLVELLDARTAVTQAKLNLIQARLDRSRALAALIRASVQ